MSSLTVVLDVRHPLAFLALGPAIAFGRSMGLAINWLPLAAQPLRRPSTPGSDDDRGVRHRRHRAHMIGREIEIYAEAQGLIVQEPYRDAPADALNQAWLWTRAHAPERLESFLVEAFHRYWNLELDAGDVTDVAKLVGPGFLEWASSEGPGAGERVAEELAAAGISTVPAYAVGNEVFYGRQHLPMIQWILEGRTGQVPI